MLPSSLAMVPDARRSCVKGSEPEGCLFGGVGTVNFGPSSAAEGIGPSRGATRARRSGTRYTPPLTLPLWH
jgi:hypothetical protein